jgi:hypothetical protein
MWEADLENRVDPAKIKLNLGGKLKKGEIKDISPDPLVILISNSTTV